VLRAETEIALERPLEWLREVYGEQLAIGALSIRYHQGTVLEEPYMSVRVRCARKDFDIVRSDLLARGATLLDEEVGHAAGVIRVTAPLAKLLGYPRHLAGLTAGSAREVMWLSHYAPCASPPSGDNAA
jgi:translation elongation factor EF-G